MADFLTSVKSVRTRSEHERKDTLLEAVRVTKQRPQQHSQEHEDPKQSQQYIAEAPKLASGSAEDALGILRSQPDVDQLMATLRYLSSSADVRHGSGASFSLHSTGPVQAQIITALINTIVPNFWPTLDSSQRAILLACLQNVAGFNAVIARLRLLSSQSSGSPSQTASQGTPDLLDIADRLFSGDDIILKVWQQLQTAVIENIKRDLAWKDFVNLIASGKVTATVAQAEDSVKNKRKGSWLASGNDYSGWLGKNIASIALADSGLGLAMEAAAQVLSKALTMGYPTPLLQYTFQRLLHAGTEDSAHKSMFVDLVGGLPMHAKRVFTEHLLRWLSSLANSTDISEVEAKKQNVSAMAGFLSMMLQDGSIKQHTLSFLADPQLSSSVSMSTQRACLASMSNLDGEDMQTLLDKLMSAFNNTLFINHTPILQQESVAQILLLAAGYVHRQMPMALLMIARSSSHMQGVSNRLDTSNTRARWLGMVIGTAVSALVDKEGSRMSFGTDEMETEEAKDYLRLTTIEDRPGILKDFYGLLQSQHKIAKIARAPKRAVESDQLTQLNGKPVFGPPRPPVQTEVIGEKVTEILDDDTDDEDNLKPYAKPDSDPEDSDEDATLVNRNKVRPPVYIRDLMAMLRDSENYDRFQLGIKHAAALIRRKANFGAEVKDHANELAVILCNLRDPFDIEDFGELKLQALIAVLLSDVKSIAPWLCKQAFTGEYSVSQRCIILSALGLGGRELAGLKNEDELNPALANTEFPSKRLPPHLHSTYTLPAASTKRLEAATKSMEHTLINPLALQAADQSTAHMNAVKVRTFSSRMDVERTKRKPAPNQLAKTFGEAFFFPLSNRYQQEIAAYGSASVFSSAPIVLVTFIKTLALLAHASGPATIGLPEILEAFWDLLLSLRVKASTDISILQAVLFALLTLLEISYDKKRIAEECPKQLMETQRWVDLIFERIGGGGLVSESGNEEETKVRTLAAGVLVKTREIVEAYQKQLIGYEFD